MNCFSKYNKTLKKTELLRVNLMRWLAAFDWLYYRAVFRKQDSFNVLNEIKETNQKQPFDAYYFSRELPKQEETLHCNILKK